MGLSRPGMIALILLSLAFGVSPHSAWGGGNFRVLRGCLMGGLGSRVETDKLETQLAQVREWQIPIRDELFFMAVNRGETDAHRYVENLATWLHDERKELSSRRVSIPAEMSAGHLISRFHLDKVGTPEWEAEIDAQGFTEFDAAFDEDYAAGRIPPVLGSSEALETLVQLLPRMLETVARPKAGEFDGPYYDVNGNFTNLVPESGKFSERTVAEEIALMHELEHAFQANRPFLDERLKLRFFFRKRMRLHIQLYDALIAVAERLLASSHRSTRLWGAALRLRMEAPELGAQWELVSRIPESMRERLIQEITVERDRILRGETEYARAAASAEKVKRLESARVLRDIALASLENAGLTKEEFVRRLAAVHGYDLAGAVLPRR